MTPADSQRIVNAYRCRKGKADPGEYMQYMAAREVLDRAGHEKLTAGQRGFLAAARLAATTTGSDD